MRRRGLLILFISPAMFIGLVARAQQPARFGPEAQKLARRVLTSPLASYLSGPGRTGLGILSGDLPLMSLAAGGITGPAIT
jgi:hypothetical protein